MTCVQSGGASSFRQVRDFRTFFSTELKLLILINVD